MNPAELISDLRQRGIELWIEEGRLKCRAPAGTLSSEMKATLADRKEEFLAFLRREQIVESARRTLVPLIPEGRRPPLFAVPGPDGDVSCFLPLARHLDADQPLLGVQPRGLDGTDPYQAIEELACYELEQIRKVRERGPYLIAGYRGGGLIAFEIARQLIERRQHVALVALIASAFPSRWDSFVDRLRRRHTEANDAPPGADHELAAARARVQQATLAAVRRYRPGPFSGDVDLFIPSGGWRARARIERWRLVARGVNEHACSTTDDGDDALLREPGVSSLAAALRQRLDGIAAAGRDGDPA